MNSSISMRLTAALTGAAVGVLAGCGGDAPAARPAPETAGQSSGPTAVVLSDTGLGELQLGMSERAAKATGMLGDLVAPMSELCRLYQGRGGARSVYFSDDKLIILYVDPEVTLDTGIGTGDSYEAVQRVYGDRVRPDNGFARVYVQAPKAPFATDYRLGIDTEYAFRDSRITEIGLESKDAGCYE